MRTERKGERLLLAVFVTTPLGTEDQPPYLLASADLYIIVGAESQMQARSHLPETNRAATSERCFSVSAHS